MLEMAVDDLDLDEALSDDVYRVYTFDFGVVDMDERFADVTGIDER